MKVLILCGWYVVEHRRQVEEVLLEQIRAEAEAQHEFVKAPVRQAAHDVPEDLLGTSNIFSAAKRDLGFTASVSLEEGLRRTVSAYRGAGQPRPAAGSEARR